MPVDVRIKIRLIITAKEYSKMKNKYVTELIEKVECTEISNGVSGL